MTSSTNHSRSVEQLHDLLSNILISEVSDDPSSALLFSGGIDSALLAQLMSGLNIAPALYSVGMTDSNDVDWSTEAAALMNLPLKTKYIQRTDIEEAIRKLVQDIGMDRPEWMAVFVPLYLAMESVDEKVVLMGQGADEVFGGYRKYRDLDPSQAEEMMASDIKELLEIEMAQYHKMADHLGKKLVLPFLDPEVISFGCSLPFEEKIMGDENKVILRELGSGIGIPEAIYQRPKKAIQYGTGVSKELRKIMRSSGTDMKGLIGTFS